MTRKQQYRANRKAAGKCVNCWRRPQPGRGRCKRCANKEKKRAENFRALGLCSNDGRKREPGRQRCSQCLLNARIWQKRLAPAEQNKARHAVKHFKGKCQCCGTRNPGAKGHWNIDHKGKKFRGIICWGCNIALGHLRDSIRVARAVIRYLRRTKHG